MGRSDWRRPPGPGTRWYDGPGVARGSEASQRAAEMTAAGPMPAARPGAATPVLPEHCLFRAVLDPRPSGMEGMSYGVGFEIRMPTDWNGRFLFQGGGGLDGVLNPALGGVAGVRIRDRVRIRPR